MSLYNNLMFVYIMLLICIYISKPQYGPKLIDI
uniref:Uncharacterized protein n=1 Tax=viral metagenome TaxID=1070528 RepID=A0A6C0J4X0_9ZZZZ